ncbi:unnamed protein product [Calicophoron daubneyi]|uniref:C2 domain-containing protein n=1 Tax=Calicophoron daubneyi TaxID=300641 RepID=A0AAV2TRP2_CALDB
MKPVLRNKTQNKAMRRLSTQYDELDMWIHNYLPAGDISKEEKDHLREVMLRDQDLKRTDAARIRNLLTSFPNRLRPELLTTAIDELRRENPAVPGSGLVSLCAPVALEQPTAIRGRMMSVAEAYVAEDSSNLSPEGNGEQNSERPRSSSLDPSAIKLSSPLPHTLNPEQDKCAICRRKLGLFTLSEVCTRCRRTLCRSCVICTNAVIDAYICKECAEIGRALCKTGDWFAQYLTSKPANPLRIDTNDRHLSYMGEPRSRDPVSPPRRLQRLSMQARMSVVNGHLEVPDPEELARHHSPNHSGPTTPNEELRAKEGSPDDAIVPETIGEAAAAPYTDNADEITQSTAQAVNSAAPTLAGDGRRFTLSKPELLPEMWDHHRKSPDVRAKSKEPIPEDSEEQPNLENVIRKRIGGRRVRSLHGLAALGSVEMENGCPLSPEMPTELEVSLDYDAKNEHLAVVVGGALNLPAPERKSKSVHLQAEVSLYPDQKARTKRKLSCKGHNTGPVFDQSVCYWVKPNELASKTVLVDVWNKKASKDNSYLGQISIPLKGYRWGDREKKRLVLRRKSIESTLQAAVGDAYRGDLKLTIRFAVDAREKLMIQANSGPCAVTGTVELWLHEGRNLLSPTDGININPFAKIILVNQTQSCIPESTDVVHRTNDPVWNAFLVFPGVKHQDLYKMSLEISIWNKVAGAKTPEYLGGIRLGLGNPNANFNDETTKEEAYLWREVLNKPNTWIDGLIPIRDISQ